MPNIASAQKKLRQSIKRAVRNQVRRSKMKTLIKKALGKPGEEDIRQAVKAIDKATKQHIIHVNKASRLKSRVMRTVSTQTKKKS